MNFSLKTSHVKLYSIKYNSQSLLHEYSPYMFKTSTISWHMPAVACGGLSWRCQLSTVRQTKSTEMHFYRAAWNADAV